MESSPVIAQGPLYPFWVRIRSHVAGWLCAAPWILGFLIFTLGPMLWSIYYSLTEYPLIRPPVWIGWENYRVMFQEDKFFYNSLRVTTVYAVVGVPLHLVSGFLMALLLNQKIRYIALWRTIYFLPSVVSGVAVALLWQWIFNSDFGLANWLLGLLGIDGPSWLLSPVWALPALILMSLWSVGGSMVIFIAGLQGVPQSLYEAADMDGANAVRRFWHVTVPMVSPVILFNLIIGLIAALQTFTQAFIMTAGGPRQATHFFMLHLYNNAFQWLKMGYASALAWVLFVYIFLVTLFVIRSSSMWVFYAGEIKGR